MAKASAPAKVILFGEHAIVYPNHTGLAGSIDRRSYVLASLNDSDYVKIETNISEKPIIIKENEISNLLQEYETLRENKAYDELKNIKKEDELSPIKIILGKMFKEYEFKGMDINIKSEIPSGSHLGSGSSVFSSIASAILSELGKETNKERISRLTYDADVLAHGGTPSGIDNTTVTFGGLIKYEKLEDSGKFELLKIDKDIPMVVSNTDKPSNTGEMVSKVRKMLQEEPDTMKMMDEISKISILGKDALQKGDIKYAGELMNNNQKLLIEFGLSTKEIDNIIDISSDFGAYGSKLTGAGGGGCVINLSEKPYELAAHISKYGYDSFVTKLGCDGVRTDMNKNNSIN